MYYLLKRPCQRRESLTTVYANNLVTSDVFAQIKLPSLQGNLSFTYKISTKRTMIAPTACSVWNFLICVTTCYCEYYNPWALLKIKLIIIINIKCSKKALCIWLTKINYGLKNINKKKILIKSRNISKWRVKYLNDIRKLCNKNGPINYLHIWHCKNKIM